MGVDKKRVLFVCGGNTCRSPMAKVILQQKLKAMGKANSFEIDSAAHDHPSDDKASLGAQAAMRRLFQEDLLAGHQSKKLTPELADQADLILVMESRMKKRLPLGKTWTLLEYAGGSGDIDDPYGSSPAAYLKCARQMSAAMDGVIARLVADDKVKPY